MSILQHSSDKKYTYADYLTWVEDEKRWEIFNGVPYMQSAPTWQHQAISSELMLQFGEYLRNKPCRIFSSPFDLRIPEAGESDEETTFVCQPDLLVICDQAGLKGTGYYGTPTLIIEISSPSTVRKDKLFKFNKFEKAGVKEYWIIEPDGNIVSVFTLQDNKRYGRPDVYSDEDKISVSTLPDLIIDLNLVFANL
ncbi:Uma2 family endonuclease [Desulfosporosinus fructosivorans]|uniref:Uma2 family endonuclease n=1 Tax=Desulfosporosinus fructosivorans TaxID=2018669 RepID=A0A4Z0R092_9FIRM|nr:Uma2 family endonuclease [Desulfosporosinus fructosivorans]TGE35745.1 Uma2 family endonuclease [Desulfosporosinus fructosivorans]